jgi:hypothetical protein
MLLWRAGWALHRASSGSAQRRRAQKESGLDLAIARANGALGAFLGLWLFFLCGGLWFGYWMKMGPVQQVHLTLMVIALLAVLVVNAPE